MGFEHRKSVRIKEGFNLCFWPANDVDGPETWGHALNLSNSGLAFEASRGLEKGQNILLEFSIPTFEHPLQIHAVVVHCERRPSGDAPYDLRVKFADFESEVYRSLKQHILEIADPKLAAVTGWGKAYFEGASAVAVKYKELTQAQYKALLSGADFQLVKNPGSLEPLTAALGMAAPGNFRILGTRQLKEHAGVELEFSFASGTLHALAEVLWSSQEPKAQAESGLSLSALQKLL